jgi:hypothetical protein
MTPDHHTPTDPSEILTNQRLGTAISALADPDRNPNGSVAHLDERERHAIREALNRSSHPLVAVAHDLLDQWDRLADDDRAAALLLLAQPTRDPERQRETGRGMGR